MAKQQTFADKANKLGKKADQMVMCPDTNFAVLSLLLLLFFSPQNSTANSKDSEIKINSAKTNLNHFFSYDAIHYEKVMIDGDVWIFVYDGIKLIECYPA